MKKKLQIIWFNNIKYGNDEELFFVQLKEVNKVDYFKLNQDDLIQDLYKQNIT